MPNIELQNVSKSFVIQTERPRSFQELMTGFWRGQRKSGEEYWALRNVSFQLEAGESLALIGANGSGKSTALKLISRIIEPTTGKVKVDGQVAALLALGAGFHPDLSGRENVYLNGSILGLKRAAIRRQFDSIVAFAELERFIDTPVRNYSSGMQVRLGFSVATAFRPDILVIDEVLAVGDQRFQDRCLRRIIEIQEGGATILLVSHDLGAVQRLCQRAVWLDNGSPRAEGKTQEVISEYLRNLWMGEQEKQAAREAQGTGLDGRAKAREAEREAKETERAAKVGKPAQGAEKSSAPHKGHEGRWGSGEVKIEKAEILGAENEPISVFRTGDRFVVRIWYCATRRVDRPAFGVSLHDQMGNRLNGPNTVWSQMPIESVQGQGYVDYIVDHLPLLPGNYDLTVAVYDYYVAHPYDHWHRMSSFAVIPGDGERQDGSVYIPCQWDHQPAISPVLPVTVQPRFRLESKKVDECWTRPT